MANDIAQRPDDRAIIQFSVFLENKVGRLNELFAVISHENVSIMALCSIDNTDSGVTRFIVNYPEDARRVLDIYGFPHSESRILALEINTHEQLREITAALAAAETNIHYLYPFLTRPNNQPALAMHVEDYDLSASVLSQQGLKVLDLMDIAR